MKYRDIQELTTKEIKDFIKENKLSYTKKKLAHSISSIDNPNELKDLRRTIAKLYTELSVRERKAKTDL